MLIAIQSGLVTLVLYGRTDTMQSYSHDEAGIYPLGKISQPDKSNTRDA